MESELTTMRHVLDGDFIGAVREFKRLHDAGTKISYEQLEQLTKLAHYPEAMQLFAFISHGGKLPPDWETKFAPLQPKQKRLAKALPKGGKDDDVKPQATGKASKKQAGKNGKTRYSYPQEQADAAPPIPSPAANPVPAPAEDAPKPAADPSELANKLGMPVQTLQRIAQRFASQPKLGGAKGFTAFMSTRLRGFAAKHKVSKDYFGLIYSSLTGGGSPPTDA